MLLGLEEGEDEMLAEGVDETEALGVGEGDAETLAEGEPDGVDETDAEGDEDWLADGVWLTDDDGEVDGLLLGLGLALGEVDGDAEVDADGDEDGDGEEEGEDDGVLLTLALGDDEGLLPADAFTLGVLYQFSVGSYCWRKQPCSQEISLSANSLLCSITSDMYPLKNPRSSLPKFLVIVQVVEAQVSLVMLTPSLYTVIPVAMRFSVQT